MPVTAEEIRLSQGNLFQDLQDKITQIPDDQIAGLEEFKDVGRGALVIAGETRKGQVQHPGLKQIANKLELQSGRAAMAAIGGAGKGARQVIGQRFDGTVMEQDPPEGSKPAVFFQGGDQLTKERRCHLSEELFQLRAQALMQSLFGIGGLSRQADDGGDAFQGKGGFGGQTGQREEELGDGNLARQSLEKAALAGEAFRVEIGQGGTQMSEVLFDKLEQNVGV